MRQTKSEAPGTQPHDDAPRTAGAPVWRKIPLDPGLHVVATPIGNLRDVTLRALDTLASAAVIACEDTRMTARLLAAYGIRTPLTPYHDHNAAAARPKLLARLAAGEAVALVSDAGTPLVSDPGYKLVRDALEAGRRVIPVPGASALLAGLVSAGLPSDRVTFAGFLPAKAVARDRALRELAGHRATLVFYESGPRLAGSLAAMAQALGAREAAVARELTKLYEEVRRGTLAELAAHYAEAGPPKGEIVVLVGPPEEAGAPADADLDARLAGLVPELGVKGAARQVAAETGMPMRDLYARALALPR